MRVPGTILQTVVWVRYARIRNSNRQITRSQCMARELRLTWVVDGLARRNKH